jgi:hypothetical protein
MDVRGPIYILFSFSAVCVENNRHFKVAFVWYFLDVGNYVEQLTPRVPGMGPETFIQCINNNENIVESRVLARYDRILCNS